MSKRFTSSVFLICCLIFVPLSAQKKHNHVSSFINPSDYLIENRFPDLKISTGLKFAQQTNYKSMKQDLLCDIYEPKNDQTESKPCIIWIHGGGFRTGSSRTQNYIVTYATDFAKRGYLCISIDYRLRDAADMPDRKHELPALIDAATDANLALEWVRSRADSLNINPDLIFIAGGSAGGRTAAALAWYNGNDSTGVDKSEWNKEGIVAAAILWGAPEMEFRSRVYPFLKSGSVPALLIHGEADKTIPVQNSLDLAKSLTEAGADNQLYTIPGASHTPTAYNVSIEKNIADFFTKQWIKKDRKYWINTLTKIVDPVLQNLSENKLHRVMPVETGISSNKTERQKFSHLEAFGRTLCGISAWLELGADSSAEGKLKNKYAGLTRLCLKNAVNPDAADYMNFSQGSQPLVDAAFLAEGILRAPNELWAKSDTITQKRIIEALKSTRKIKPGENNWLLFSALIEAALLKFSGDCNMTTIDYAIARFKDWYKGDGWYGDGKNLHFDYYNSIVIHPLMMDMLAVLKDKNRIDSVFYNQEKRRQIRYAAELERLISPEATYPAMGRSLSYRFGIFHCMSQVALQHNLPTEIKPSQVRAALTSLIQRQLAAPGTFDSKGWLTTGFCGYQPEVAESYISTGSLYMCTAAFLVLGLPETDAFWSSAPAEWTNLKAWGGKALRIDHAIQN